MTSIGLPRRVVARHLGLDPDGIDPDRPLASYGLDSLRSMELLAALEDATGRALPESFCFDYPTLTALAGALEGVTVGGAPWQADLELPADVVVTRGDVVREPRHVFLTGATGLVGGYLLRTLIDETSAQVWCLVRATPGEGLARIRANLARYGLWDDALATRIEVVRGDLGHPNLGLSQAEYRSVATMTDAVLHAGADVDWVQPYSALRSVNVVGTVEVLRLAGAARPKPVQFISSLSVCHVPGGPPVIDERTDCAPFIDRLPLGYAKTKTVGERLCEGAWLRGLPMRIIRPALVAGDSRSGASNVDDLVGRLVRGCIEMRAAPDLDWSFDAIPVDELARAIVATPWPRTGECERVHLMSPRPRSWQECVLWINLIGYTCRLLPFAEWRRRLEWVGRSPSHPLAPLRPFFADEPGKESPAELCQASRHSAVAVRPAGEHSSARLRLRGVDAPMLARQIDGYVTAGVLQPTTSTRRQSTRGDRIPPWRRPDDLAALLGRRLGGDLAVRSIDAVDSDPTLGIVSDLSSWRRGRETGVFRYSLSIERGGRPEHLAVVIKARAHDDEALEAARALADACDDDLAHQVRRFEGAIGLRGGSDREVALYERTPDDIGRVMPACYGTWDQTDEDGGGLILEDLQTCARLNATEPADWTGDDLRIALEGLAVIHTTGLASDVKRLFHPLRGTADVLRMRPLWTALARHATPSFERSAGAALPARHAALVDTLNEWAPTLDGSPSTLIHHDFSPRNAAIRTSGAGRSLVTYDWELATIGLPQRDLAEFLCFVLPADVEAARVVHLVEGYRRVLEHASGRRWPRQTWDDGFRAAHSLLLVDRLAFYAMIARVRPQPFLPDVLRTWLRLDAIVTSSAWSLSPGHPSPPGLQVSHS